MKKINKLFLIMTIIFSLVAPTESFASDSSQSEPLSTIVVSEDLTLQNNNKAFTEQLLLVKNQQNATQRAILLKFNYEDIDMSNVGKVDLDLYAVYRTAVGKENPNNIAVYWSPSVSWTSSSTSWTAMPSNLTEIGDNLISMPTIANSSDASLNKYYNFDVSSALFNNTNANKEITFVIKQKTASTNSSCGFAFAKLSSGESTAAKLDFYEGVQKPDAHIKNGAVVSNIADTALKFGDESSQNFGDSQSISVSNVPEVSKALLKFDLSDYNLQDISGVGLRLYITGTDLYKNTLIQAVGVNAADWNEKTVCADTQPTVGNITCDYKVNACKTTDYWIDIDVTEIIRNSSDLSKASILLQQIGNNSDGITFSSKESEYKLLHAPHLVISESQNAVKAVTDTIITSDDVYARYDNTSTVNYSELNFNNNDNGTDLMVKMNENADRKAFIKFDLSNRDIDFDNVKTDFSVYYMGKSGTGVDSLSSIEVYYCPDSNWSDLTLTGNKALSMVESAYKAENLVGTFELGTSTADVGYHSINVADAIKKHINDSYTKNITFMLVQANVAGSNGGVAFTSKETNYARAAKLEIYPNIPRGYFAKPVKADAHIRYGSYSSKNFGSEQALDVKNYDDDLSSVRELFIKADISNVPEGRNDKVKLILPINHMNLGTVNGKIYGSAYEEDYDDTWSETMLTADSLSADYDYLDTDAMTYIGDFSAKKTDIGSYLEIDVSDYVNPLIESGCTEVTFKITENDVSDVNNIIQFYSKESIYKPMIAYGFNGFDAKVTNMNVSKNGDTAKISAILSVSDKDTQGWKVNNKQSATAISAGYDQNGRFVGLAENHVTLEKEGKGYSAEIEGADTIKLFTWNSLSKMSPYGLDSVTDESLLERNAAYYSDAEFGEFTNEIADSLKGDTTDYLKEREKIVVAALMSNQRTPYVSGKWQHWNNSSTSSGEYNYTHSPYIIDPDTGLRDIAASDYPSIGLFDVTDPDYVDYQIQLMKMAGVDAVSININDSYNGCLWKINNIKNNIVPALEKYGLKGFARIDSYTQSAFTNEQLTSLVTMFGDTILKIDNRPVISLFSNINQTEMNNLLNGWKTEFAEDNNVEPFVMKWLYTYSETSVNNSYDGLYNWVGGNTSNCSTSDDYEKYYTIEQSKENYVTDALTGKSILTREATDDKPLNYYAEGVSPAFDNKPVMGWGGSNDITKIDGGVNGELYKYKWANAANNQMPMIMIPTWDDWSEGTQIMPTLSSGNMNLLITRHYAAMYKNETEQTNADFNISDWIYKIRKTTNDVNILAEMEIASEYIAAGEYDTAKALVLKYALELKIPNVTTRFSY